MIVCFLGIGSNLGDRRKTIKDAIKKINSLKDTHVLKLSKVITSNPVGGPRHQPQFLNAVLKIETGLSPFILLSKIKNIEKSLGREKTVRNGPRAIDLDILFYGDEVIDTAVLKIPHPRILERDFVIKPLLEVI